MSPADLFRVMVVALVGWGCADVCETGERCARDCPPGGAAICAAHGLCACLLAPDAGGSVDAGPVGLPDGPDAAPGEPTADPTGCRAPALGDVVVNEVMLDGEPTEDAEFVELVNTRPEPIAMTGLALTSNRGTDQVRRVLFTGGCLPPGAAVAVFADRAAWIEPLGAPWPLEAELRSFGFANGGDFDFRLVRGDVVIDRLEGAGALIEAGVSLNRDPDLRGLPALHATVDPAGRPASPGRCPNGGRYETGCAAPEGADIGADIGLALDAGTAGDAGLDDADAAPDNAPPFDCEQPIPGEIRINEILIDGRVPRTEADEFVELVNTAGEPRSLRGLSLGVERAAGDVEVRVAFADGCLPALGVVVLRPDPVDWDYRPPPARAPVVDDARLALGNESRSAIVVLGEDGAELDRFDPAGLDIVEGVSLNRRPELIGEAWVLHGRLAVHDASPGTCADGRPFDAGCPSSEDACPPATAASLMINEVLIDGVEDDERDEFVELLNIGREPVGLSGLSLWSGRRDGALVERVVFERGCLPPGAIAVFADRADWLGLEQGIEAESGRLSLHNEAPVVIELRSGQVSWSVELRPGEAESGVSLNRAVDGDPEAPWGRHDGDGLGETSPGMRRDGTPFPDPAASEPP